MTNRKGFLGIDVSKGYADFVLIDNNKSVIERCFRLNDTTQDRKQLGELIDGWLEGVVESIFCGVESTGGYENNWYNYLQGLGGQLKAVKVARLNAKGVKGISDAALTRTVTDQVSAISIANYLVCFPEKVCYSGAVKEGYSVFKDGRSYYCFIQMLQKQKVQISNQLEKLLYQHFNEVLIYCRHGIPLWLLTMISKYPGAALVKKAGIRNLEKIKGISAGKAASILKRLEANRLNPSDTISYTIASMSREILQKEEQIASHKLKLSKSFSDNEDVKLLDSVPGIATDSAVGLMIEIENIDRFDSCRKLCAYFGVHPTFKQSGDGKWGSHMSKKGRSAVRRILYMSALTAIRWDPSLKQLYARKRTEGFNHYQAMGVIMHKLLRMIYGILKNKSPFNAATDQANKQNAIKKQEKKQQNVKEEKEKKKTDLFRFKSSSLQAPISRHAAGKIKKQMTSQT
jgi:transposase